VLQLLDAEDEVLVVLAGREARPPETLLRSSIDQRPRAGGAFPSASHYLVHEGLALLALDTTLVDQVLDYLLNTLARRGGCAYLQENQTLERLTKRSAHGYLL
jgi:hypothetical protein